MKIWLALILILVACVPTVTPAPPTLPPRPPTSTPPISQPPTPTRIVSPISPVVTPARVAPIVTSRVITAPLVNGDFEGGFTHPNPDVQEFTVGAGWSVFWFDRSPCARAGEPGCIIKLCPMNCQKADGSCPTNSSCWWMRPEYKATYKPDYVVPRTHSGLWAQYAFSQGRQSWSGIYQRVYVGAGNIVTATMWALAWQCLNSPDCRYSHMNTARQAELRAAWGITQTTKCPDDTFCTWPASDVPYYLNPANPRINDPAPTMHIQIGIDPTGTFTGTQWSGKYYDDGQKVWLAPNLSNIVWSAEKDSWDTWTQYTITATAKSDYITVVASWRPEWFTSHWNNDLSIDQVEVLVQAKTFEPLRVYLPVVRR